jgi:predicted ester cyclase
MQSNGEIVLRYIDELNHRNITVIDELVAEGFRNNVKQGYIRNTTAFPDYFVEVEQVISEGEYVAVKWMHSGTHLGIYEGIPPTGKKITGRAITIYRLINGQIADADGIWDRGEVWQQLGLIPDSKTIFKDLE